MSKSISLMALFLLSSLFIACSDSKISSDVFSQGAETSKETLEEMRNIDKKSYAEVADVFLDNNLLSSNGKTIMLVFGANGCVYCDKLKEVIKNNNDVKTLLNEEFSPYYINGSYTKTHTIKEIPQLNTNKDTVSTQELIQKYSIGPTPTLVFLDSEGELLFTYPGFLPKDRFLIVLDFFSKKNTQNFSNKSPKEIARILQETFENKGV